MKPTSTPQWLSDLALGWDVPREGFGEGARELTTLHDAWMGQDAPLLLWLAARLAPSTPAFRSAVDTAREIVRRHLTLVPSQQLDLCAFLDEVSGHPGALDDRNAWRQVRARGVVCTEAAQSGLDLAAAAFRVASVRVSGGERDPRVRAVPALLASACHRAQGAFGNFMSEHWGAFARLASLADVIRGRHVLRSDGSIVAIDDPT